MEKFYETDNLLNMAPGPVQLTMRVLRSQIRAFMNPFQEDFEILYSDTQTKLKTLANTKSDVLILNGAIRAGLDAAICSLIQPKDKVLVCVNGYWSELFKTIVKAHGGVVTVVEGEWGQPIDPGKVEAKLDEGKEVKAVILVHSETSTGVLNPVEEIGKIAKNHGNLFIVDMANTLGNTKIEIDKWNVDVAVTGSQKSLSALPGIAIVYVNAKAWEAMEKRKSPIRGWYTNLLTWRDYFMRKQGVPFTLAASLIVALHESLNELFEEGLENVFMKHEVASLAFRMGIRKMGLNMVANCQKCEGCDSKGKYCSNNVVAVKYPKEVDDVKFRRDLLQRKYGMFVAPCIGKLAGCGFRVGLMSKPQISRQNILRSLTSIGYSIRHFGVQVNIEKGLEVANEIYKNIEDVKVD